MPIPATRVCLASGAGEGIFWFLVAVIWIVAQIVKARKRKESQPVQTTFEETPPSAEDELRTFLESLSSSARPQQEVTPPPLPVSPAVVRPRTAASDVRDPNARMIPVSAPPVVDVPPPPPPAAQRVDAYGIVRDAAHVYRTRAREALLGQLRKRESVRQAVLLREVIGPPLALQ
jgi:hypothetical protein